MAKFSKPNKLNLALAPTPIHKLEFVSKLCSTHGPANVFVKRDDFNHGPAAGNKIRKLEYLLADALKQKKKVIVTCGGEQSNHARATAVLTRQLGLECVLVLRKDRDQRIEGNLLLDHLWGAKIVFVEGVGEKVYSDAFESIGEFYLQRDGALPYFIPEGGTSALGALGYADAFDEILKQCGNSGVPEHFDSIVVANGSGGTHAGLLLGRLLAGAAGMEALPRIVSFNVCRTAKELADRVNWSVVNAIQTLGAPISFMPADVDVVDGYVGKGYAEAGLEWFRFWKEVCSADGVLFDPVYSGKALRGLVAEMSASPERANRFGRNVLLIHTGGFPSVFARTAEFASVI